MEYIIYEELICFYLNNILYFMFHATADCGPKRDGPLDGFVFYLDEPSYPQARMQVLTVAGLPSPRYPR